MFDFTQDDICDYYNTSSPANDLAGGCGRNLARPGATRCIPPNPDVDGYHWVRRYRGGPAIPLAWFALWHTNSGRGWGKWCEPNREDQWEYLGPCPSPDDRPHPPLPDAGGR
jgi:hypothetical protein